MADIPAEDNDIGLGLMNAAEALAEFISGCATPLTIGLQGDWGSGKTSLMNFIELKLPDKMRGARTKLGGHGHHVSLWFNTWAYSQFGREDELALSLLTNLTRELQRKLEGVSGGDSASADRLKGSVRKFGRMLASVAADVATAQTAVGRADVAGARRRARRQCQTLQRNAEHVRRSGAVVSRDRPC